MRRNRREGDVEFARALRREATNGEQRLWTYLRDYARGYKFRRQHAMAGFVLDFYCPSLKLAIELDGPHHDAEKDAIRDQTLSSFGLKVVRLKSLSMFKQDRDIGHFIEAHIRIRLKELELSE